MKHTLKITLIILLLFLIAQYIGIYVASKSIGKELALGIAKPQLEETTSFIYIFVTIIIVTLIALFFARFNLSKLWKVWFFLSITLVLTISLGVFMNEILAFILAFIAAVYKIIRPNMIIHNLSELFLYGGLAALFVESLNVFSVSILILLILIYDMYAVWKSKHMIKLANFQSKLKIFTGLMIPYKHGKKEKIALLGGGDIGFPILFASVVMKSYGFLAFVIPLFAALGLYSLLVYGDKDKFYPAMPFIGGGCFLGYGLIVLIGII